MLVFENGFIRLVSARPLTLHLAVALLCVIGSAKASLAQTQQIEGIARVTYSGSSTDVPGPLSGDTETDATPVERRAFELVNSIRVKNGLPEFKWDPELYRIARNHSHEMGRRGFFSHIGPDGGSPRDRMREAGVKAFRVVAENIAYNQGYDDPGGFAVERWMASTGHRDNILNREFQASAIGVFVNSEGCVYLTQLFILR